MDFAEIFERLTLHAPLPWQTRLYGELLDGRVPTSLDLPTGLGKTSVIAVWLAARAAGAPVPRRLVYIVDRRAVVDQATEVAQDVAKRLGTGIEADDVVLELRAALGLAAPATLPVSTLRGQYVDNREWLESPTVPSIIVGTIDMIGSRLLFQGYGVSPRMRPVHAALLGADALLVLDEAHLVPPFEHLLRSVAAFRRPQEVPNVSVLSLSATGRAAGDAPFQLVIDDLKDPRTSKRLRAIKRLSIEDVGGDLAESMVQRALERGGTSSRVIVFCDSRRVAQKVYARLALLIPERFGRD